MGKNQIVIEQMNKTLKELQAIDKHNKEWTNDMNQRVERLRGLAEK